MINIITDDFSVVYIKSAISVIIYINIIELYKENKGNKNRESTILEIYLALCYIFYIPVIGARGFASIWGVICIKY